MSLKGKFLSSSVPGVNLNRLFGASPGPLTEVEQVERRAAQAGHPFSRFQHKYWDGVNQVVVEAVRTPGKIFVHNIALNNRTLGEVVRDLLPRDQSTSLAEPIHASARGNSLPGLKKA